MFALFLRPRTLIAFCCLVLGLTAAPLPATAHPHVWINYYVKALSSKEGIKQLDFTWELDEQFTSMVKETFKLKTITEKDSDFVRDNAFMNLKNYHFYMNIKTDGVDFQPKEVSHFIARQKGKQLEYQFTVTLPKPSQQVELSLSDPEFYVDIEPPMQEVSPVTAGKSFLANAVFTPKDFVSVGAEAGAASPTCENKAGDARKSNWGDFPVYLVLCHSNP